MAKKTIKISMMRVMEFHSENGEIYCTSTSKCRGSGTGGAGGAVLFVCFCGRPLSKELDIPIGI